MTPSLSQGRGAERRQHPRRASDASFTARWNGHEAKLRAADVSEGGSFLMGEERPEVGEQVTLRPGHHLAEAGRIVLRGLVRHRRAAGVGVEWVEARADAGAEVLHRYLNTALRLYLAPPHTDPGAPTGEMVAYRFDKGRFVAA